MCSWHSINSVSSRCSVTSMCSWCFVNGVYSWYSINGMCSWCFVTSCVPGVPLTACAPVVSLPSCVPGIPLTVCVPFSACSEEPGVGAMFPAAPQPAGDRSCRAGRVPADSAHRLTPGNGQSLSHLPGTVPNCCPSRERSDG